MKLTILVVLLTTFLAVQSLPLGTVEENGNYISERHTKEPQINNGENDLKPAEFFYPGLGGFGFGYPGYGFYSRPYWHHFHGYRPYYGGYYSGLGGQGSHWHYRY